MFIYVYNTFLYSRFVGQVNLELYSVSSRSNWVHSISLNGVGGNENSV